MSTSIFEQFGVQHPQPPDEHLLSEARSGNRQAFGGLCFRYSGMLRQRIFQIVRHQEDAEDVLQETLLKAYQHLQTFRGACSFSTWLVAIGTNMSLMLLGKRKAWGKYSCDAVMEDGETLVMEFRDPALDPEQRYMMSQTSQKLNRTDVRRMAYRQLFLALDFLYQRARRNSGSHPRFPARQRSALLVPTTSAHRS